MFVPSLSGQMLGFSTKWAQKRRFLTTAIFASISIRISA
jgi:hypothetical protein